MKTPEIVSQDEAQAVRDMVIVLARFPEAEADYNVVSHAACYEFDEQALIINVFQDWQGNDKDPMFDIQHLLIEPPIDDLELLTRRDFTFLPASRLWKPALYSVRYGEQRIAENEEGVNLLQREIEPIVGIPRAIRKARRERDNEIAKMRAMTGEGIGTREKFDQLVVGLGKCGVHNRTAIGIEAAEI